MCKRITCSECGKPSWEGCGGHIEKALKGVPQDERCKCERKPTHACRINKGEDQKNNDRLAISAS